MPQTIITERDDSIAGIGSVVNHNVYVPGYSIVGPTNVPTLIRSVSEFQNTFGNKPYEIKSSQNQDGMYFPGDSERSWLFAKGLLDAGNTIMFERIANTSVTERAYYDLPVLSQQYTALVSGDTGVINLTGNIVQTSEPEDEVFVYTISDTVSPSRFTNAFYGLNHAETVITLLNGDAEIHYDSDNSRFDIIDNRVDASTSLSYANGVFEITTSIEFNSTEFSLSSKYVTPQVSGTALWYRVNFIPGNNPVVTFGDSSTTTNQLYDPTKAEVILDNSNYYVTLTFPYGNTAIQQQLSLSIPVTSNQYIKIKAKYQGEHYKNIGFTLVEGANDPSIGTYYRLKLVLDNLVEDVTFSLISGNTYSWDTLNSNLIDFELSPGLNKALLNTGLYSLQEFTSINPMTRFRAPSLSGDEFTVANFLDFLGGADTPYANLADNETIDIEFITSGGYPNYRPGYESVAIAMANAAVNRTEAIALIDAQIGVDGGFSSSIDLKNSIYNEVTRESSEVITQVNLKTKETSASYVACFSPFGKYSINNTIVDLPASFGYLINVPRNKIYEPIGGIEKGLITGLISVQEKINKAVVEELTSKTAPSINPIVLKAPFGYCVYGDRTLSYNPQGLKKASFLHVRRITNEIKKTIYPATEYLRFYLDNTILWDKFKSLITPKLDELVSAQALQYYRIKRVVTTEKLTMKAEIIIAPYDSAEEFAIDLVLNDTTLLITE